MEIKNYTPHPITVRGADGTETTYPSEGVARVLEEIESAGELAGVPVVRKVLGGLAGLPEPERGVVYMVSAFALTAAVAEGREDCVAPDTGPQSAVRNEKGHIVAVRGFIRA